MKNDQVTIRDVARTIGVSHQTVSRVINNRPGVSPETKKLVENAIAKLGYWPNASAQSLAAGRTNTLACISPNLTDYTFAAIIEGAEQYARQNNIYLLSVSAPDERGFATLINSLCETRRVDGLLIINPYIDERSTFIPKNFPTVFIGDTSKSDNIGWITLDNFKAGYLATDYLINYKHQNIVCIKGLNNEACTRDRFTGYIRALENKGIAPQQDLILQGDWTASSAYSAINELIKEEIRFSAVFAQNDRMAIGAIRCLKDNGLIVPDQVSVISIDDMPLASYFDPPLTTIRQDFTAIGEESAKILIKNIYQPEDKISNRKFPVRLIERRSVSEYIQ